MSCKPQVPAGEFPPAEFFNPNLFCFCFCVCRLNCEDGDGAWCPQGQLEPSDSQYLQVCLVKESEVERDVSCDDANSESRGFQL